MKALFWRLAFKLYARPQPSVGFELFTIGGVGFIAVLYAAAVLMNPTVANAVRLVVAVLIVAIGLAHGRIRLERQKGPNALHVKVAASKS
jgi:UDP-N-acetylmuramyl pentapeptide phosphotransferase/UDP-N-acetylglucosamine-1-phosphate transferase